MTDACSRNFRRGCQPLRGRDPQIEERAEEVRDQKLALIESHVLILYRRLTEGQVEREEWSNASQQAKRLRTIRNDARWWLRRLHSPVTSLLEDA